MKQYIALLRGINVGGKHKVPMRELKHLFEEMGFSNVRTYINSGNILFKGDTVNQVKLQSKLENHFGFEIPIVVLEKKWFLEIARTIPDSWQNDAKQKSDVLFLWESFNDVSVLEKLDPISGVDRVAYVAGAVLWSIGREDQNKSRMQKGFVGSELYKNMTARNVNTVRKLADLLSE